MTLPKQTRQDAKLTFLEEIRHIQNCISGKSKKLNSNADCKFNICLSIKLKLTYLPWQPGMSRFIIDLA